MSTRVDASRASLSEAVIGRTLIRVALCCAALGIVLMAANVSQDLYEHATGRAVSERIWLLDVDAEDSIYTWLSLAVLFTDAVAMALIANLRGLAGRSDSIHWGVLAFGFAGLSMDEAVSLHEKLSDVVAASLHLTGIWAYGWIVPALVIVIAAGMLFLPFLLRMPFGIARGLVMAGILFVGGAVGMEMVSGFVVGAPDQANLTYRFLAAIEESLELAGALLCLYVIGGNVSELGRY